jgi:hypothetical protein
MSWGRFHSVYDNGSSRSDVDLLAIVEDFDQLDGANKAKSGISMFECMTDFLPDLKDAGIREIDVVVVKFIPAGYPFEATFSFVRRMSFLRLMRSEDGLIRMWRKTPPHSPAPESVAHTDVYGRIHELPIARAEACKGFVDCLPVNPRSTSNLVPNAFQMMLLPLQEYIGRCDPEIVSAVASMSALIETKTQMNDPWAMHMRSHRMPMKILNEWNAHLLHGPRKLNLEEYFRE